MRNTDIEDTANFVQTLGGKIKKELIVHIEKVVEDIAVLRQQLDDQFDNTPNLEDFADLKRHCTKRLAKKVNLSEVTEALNACQEDLANRFA